MMRRWTRRRALGAGAVLPMLLAACAAPPPSARRERPLLIEFYADW